MQMPENKWPSFVSEIKGTINTCMGLQTSHLEEMLKNIFKKTENSHENEIKKIYEEQKKELLKQISEQQKALSEKDSVINRQNRDIMEKERLIMDLQKQLQSVKEDHFAKEKELFFLRGY